MKKLLISQELLVIAIRYRTYLWRRDRDSNPGYAINVHTLSRRAPSAARTSLRLERTIDYNIELYFCPAFHG